MKSNVFVRLEVSESSGYMSINKMFFENELQDEYESMVATMKKWGRSKWETLEGYKLMFLLVNVTYDGRKKKINEEDILKSLEKTGLVTKAGYSMFGGYYIPTEELKTILENNLNQRKILVGVA